MSDEKAKLKKALVALNIKAVDLKFDIDETQAKVWELEDIMKLSRRQCRILFLKSQSYKQGGKENVQF